MQSIVSGFSTKCICTDLSSSGGLGLTGGLADVDSLFDCLIGIHEGRASDSILDKYDQVRREKWHKFINVWSTDNFRRLIYLDPDKALEKDKFLQNLVEHETDTDFNRNLQLVSDIFAFNVRN